MHGGDNVEPARRELEQFLLAAGHDLAEPARTIRSFLDLLERRHGESFASDAREFIGFARDAAVRLDLMLNSLLELGRLGTKLWPCEALNLQDVADAVAASAQERLTSAGGKLTVGQLPAIQGNRRLWSRLLEILVDNAITYRSASAPDIRLVADANHLTIEDNGIGIPENAHERIFEAFQRLHARDSIPGIGMGLAVAKRICELQGCRISVRSRDGGGSIFIISLPEHAAISQ